MIDIVVNSKKLDFALARLADAAKVDLGKIIKQEGGNVSKSIMMIVPPTATALRKDNKPKTSGMSTAAKEQGQNAIKSDLFGGKRKSGARYSSIGLFQRIGSSTLIPPKKARTQTAGVNLGWERSKTIRIYFKFWNQNASIEQMGAFHKRYRNNLGRTGFVSQSTIGRWKVQDQMWISNSAADAYLANVQSRVGYSKAGAAAAAIACGIRVPAWIRRHASKAGATRYNFGQNPYIIGTATSNKIPDIQRYYDAALKFREKITLEKVKRLLANKAVNLGFAKVDGHGNVVENMPQ
jgi:hypothetical protein